MTFADEVTPTVPSGFNEILSAGVEREKPYVRSYFGRLLDRVTFRAEYLATLPQESILAGALTAREVAELETLERGYQSTMRDVLARADAHVARLGEGYRQRIYAEAVKGAVNG